MRQDIEISFSVNALRRLYTEGIIASQGEDETGMVKDAIRGYLRGNPKDPYIYLNFGREYLFVCICTFNGRHVSVDDIELTGNRSA